MFRFRSLPPLAAYAHSPATAQALVEELSISQPVLLRCALRNLVTDMPGKAYRWSGEMEEISGFVQEGIDKKGKGATATPVESDGADSPALIHRGLAALYQNIADELAKEGQGDVGLLREWAAEAHRLLDARTK
jgi:hypothetical protein